MNKDQNTAVLERDVRELSLGDMLIQVFRHWKAIVIAAIIGALVFTGISCYLGVSGPRARAAQEAAANGSAVDEVTQARLDGMNQVRNHFRDIAVAQSRYVQNSIYMQLDPYAVPRTAAVLWVLPSGEVSNLQIDELITLYTDAAGSREILEPIAEEYGVEYWALKEVVGVGSDFDRNRVWINVSFTDLDASMDIAQRIVDALQSRTEGYSGQFFEHRLVLASISKRVLVDTGILEGQNAAWVSIHNNNGAIEKVGEDISDIRPSASSLAPAVRSIPVDIAIGAVIGFAVCFVALFLAYMGADKVRSDDEIRRMAPMRVWANNIAPADHKGSALALDKLQGMTPWEEGAYRRFADIFAPELEGKDSLLLVTALDEKDVSEIAGELEKALNVKLGGAEPAFKVNVCANVSDSYTAVEAIRGAEAVLVVERAHLSSLKKVRNELELMSHVREDAMGVMVRGI